MFVPHVPFDSKCSAFWRDRLLATPIGPFALIQPLIINLGVRRNHHRGREAQASVWSRERSPNLRLPKIQDKRWRASDLRNGIRQRRWLPIVTDILQDEVIRATDLNRASGEVLNKASRTPVTIVRNEETFALMRRDVAAGWRKEATCATHMTELIWHALAHPDTMGPQFEWIGAFDEDDKREMVNELMNLYRKATRGGSWDDLDAAIHEWSESGWAALSSEVADAFNAPSERIPLDKARAV